MGSIELIECGTCDIPGEKDLNSVVYCPKSSKCLVSARNRIFISDHIHAGHRPFQVLLKSDSNCFLKYLGAQGGLLIYNDADVSFRRCHHQGYLFKTALQRNVSYDEDKANILLEVPVSEAKKLLECVGTSGFKDRKDVTFDANVLKQLSDGVASLGGCNDDEAPLSERWDSVCIEAPYNELRVGFVSLLDDIRQKCNSNQMTRGPELPIVSAMVERLNIMRPVPYQFEANADSSGLNKACVASEVARSSTFANWPHMHYKWCLPDQMAEAGFYHQPNDGGDDRALCFTCSLCLVCWEPSDEPWSEHDRHAPQCPLIRTLPTENVPAAVTYASWPAYGHQTNEPISVVGATANCDLVATGARHGEVVLWNLNKYLQRCASVTIDPTEPYLSMRTGYHVQPRRTHKVSWAEDTNAPGNISAQDAVLVDTIREVITDMPPGEIANEIGVVAPEEGDVVIDALCCYGQRRDQVKRSFYKHLVASPALFVGCGLAEQKLVKQTLGADLALEVEMTPQSKEKETAASPPSSFVENLNTLNRSESVQAECIICEPEDGASTSSVGAAKDVLTEPSCYRPFILVYKVEEEGQRPKMQQHKSPDEQGKRPFKFTASSGTQIDEDNALYDPLMYGGPDGGSNYEDSSWLDSEPFFEVEENLNLKLASMTGMYSDLQDVEQDIDSVVEDSINNNPTLANVVDAEASVPVTIQYKDDENMQIGSLDDSCGYDSSPEFEASIGMAGTMGGASQNPAPETMDAEMLATINAPPPAMGVFFLQCVRLPMEFDSPSYVIHSITPLAGPDYVLVAVNKVVGGPALGTPAALLLYKVSFTGAMTGIDEKPSRVVRLGTGAVLGMSESVEPINPNKPNLPPNETLKSLVVLPQTISPDSSSNLGYAAFTTSSGQFLIVSVDTGDLATQPMKPNPELGKFVLCTYAGQPEQIYLTTEEGQLSVLQVLTSTPTSDDFVDELMRVKSGISAAGAEKILDYLLADKELLITRPLTLDVLTETWALTTAAPSPSPSANGSSSKEPVKFQAEAPTCWTEVSEVKQEARARKNPLKVAKNALTRTWHLVPDKTTWREHLFEVTLPSSMTISHINFKFDLTPLAPAIPKIQVTLLQQLATEGKERAKTSSSSSAGTSCSGDSGYNRALDAAFLRRMNAKVVAGPLDIADFVAVNDGCGMIQFAGADLMSSRSKTLFIHMQALTTEEETEQFKKLLAKQEKVAPAPPVAVPEVPKPFGASAVYDDLYPFDKSTIGSKVMWAKNWTKPPAMPQKPAKESKVKETLKGCDWLQEVSIALHAVQRVNVSKDRKQRFAIIHYQRFHQSLVETFLLPGTDGRRSPGHAEYGAHLALDVLLWLGSNAKGRYSRKEGKSFTGFIADNIAILLRNLVILGSRSLAHKFSCWVLSLVAQAQDESFVRKLQSGFVDSLPYLHNVRSSGSLCWYFGLAYGLFAAPSLPGHRESEREGDLMAYARSLIDLLQGLSRECVTRKNQLHSLLNANFNLWGLPMELEMFDLPPTVLVKSVKSVPSTYASAVSQQASNLTANLALKHSSAAQNWMDVLNATRDEKTGKMNGKGFFNTFGPRTLKRVFVGSDFLPGLLDAEPLVFSFHSASEGMKIENLQKGTSTLLDSSNMPPSVGPFPLPDLSEMESASAQSPALSNAVTSMKLQVQSLLSQQMQMFGQNAQPLAAEVTQDQSADVSESGPATQASSASTFGVPTTPKTTPAFMTPTPLSPSHLSPMNSESQLNYTDSGDGGGASSKDVSSQNGILSIPVPYALVINSMNSGARRFVILDFGQPILLTDVLMPNCAEVGSLALDCWCRGEHLDSQRLVTSNDISTKTLVLSDISPPMLCQFLKISFVGRHGLNSAQCKLPVGSFFGHKFYQPWQAYAAKPPLYDQGEILDSFDHQSDASDSTRQKMLQLMEDLRCRYTLARHRLQTGSQRIWIEYGQVPDSEPALNLMDTYSECMQLKIHWNIVHRAFDRLYGTSQAFDKELSCCSTDKIWVLSSQVLQQLVALIHIPLGPDRDLCSTPLLGFSVDDAVAIFDRICSNGPARTQALCGVFLLECCSQLDWWGDFFPKVLKLLYHSQTSESGRTEGLVLFLVFLVQKTVAAFHTAPLEASMRFLCEVLSADARERNNDLADWIIFFLSSSLNAATGSLSWDFLLGEYAPKRGSTSSTSAAGEDSGHSRKERKKKKVAETLATQLAAQAMQEKNWSAHLSALKQAVGLQAIAEMDEAPAPGKMKTSTQSSKTKAAFKKFQAGGRDKLRKSDTKHPSSLRVSKSKSHGGIMLRLPHELCAKTARLMVGHLLETWTTRPLEITLSTCKVVMCIAKSSLTKLFVLDVFEPSQLLLFLRHTATCESPLLRHGLTVLLAEIMHSQYRVEAQQAASAKKAALSTEAAGPSEIATVTEERMEVDVPEPDTAELAKLAIQAAVKDVVPMPVESKVDLEYRKQRIQDWTQEFLQTQVNAGKSLSSLDQLKKDFLAVEMYAAKFAPDENVYASLVSKSASAENPVFPEKSSSLSEVTGEIMEAVFSGGGPPADLLASLPPDVQVHFLDMGFEGASAFGTLPDLPSAFLGATSMEEDVPGPSQANEKISESSDDEESSDATTTMAEDEDVVSKKPAVEAAADASRIDDAVPAIEDDVFASTSTEERVEQRPPAAKRVYLSKQVSQISLSMDERSENHLSWDSYNAGQRAYLCLQVAVQSRLNSPGPKLNTAMLSQSKAESAAVATQPTEGARSLGVLSECFAQMLADLSIMSAASIRNILETYWHLSIGAFSKLSFSSHSADKHTVVFEQQPKVPLSPACVLSVVSTLASRGEEFGFDTWALLFKVLAVICNQQGSVEPLSPSSQAAGMAGFIVESTPFKSLLLTFLSLGSYGSQVFEVGPIATQALQNFLSRLHVQCNAPGRQVGMTLRNTLFGIVIELLERKTLLSSGCPSDALNCLVTFLCSVDCGALDSRIVVTYFQTLLSVLKHYLYTTAGECKLSGAPDPRHCHLASWEVNKEVKTVSKWQDAFLINCLKLAARLTKLSTPIPVTMEAGAGPQGASNASQVKEVNMKLWADVVLSDGRSTDMLFHILSTCTASVTDVTTEAIKDFSTAVTPADGVLLLAGALYSNSPNGGRTFIDAMVAFLKSESEWLPRCRMTPPLLSIALKAISSEASLWAFVEKGGVSLLTSLFIKSCREEVPSLSNHWSLLVKESAYLSNYVRGPHHSTPPASEASSPNRRKYGVGAASFNQMFAPGYVPSATTSSSPYIPVSLSSGFGSQLLPPGVRRDVKVDGMTNFAPLGKIKSSSPMAQHLQTLLQSSQGYRRCRTAAWSYHFYQSETWLDLTITLPYPVMLHEVQLRPHAPSLQSSPSAVQVEVAADSSSGKHLKPIGPPVPTAGLTKIRVTTSAIEHPVQVVRIHLHRPAESANVGISQILLLGYPMFSGNDSSASRLDMQLWLSLIHHCLKQPSWSTEVQPMDTGSEASVDVPPGTKAAREQFTKDALLLSRTLLRFILRHPGGISQLLDKVEFLLLLTEDALADSNVTLVRTLLEEVGTTSSLSQDVLQWVLSILHQISTTACDGRIDKSELILNWLQGALKEADAVPRLTLSLLLNCISSIVWSLPASSLAPCSPDLLRSLFGHGANSEDEGIRRGCGNVLCALTRAKVDNFIAILEFSGIVDVINCAPKKPLSAEATAQIDTLSSVVQSQEAAGEIQRYSMAWVDVVLHLVKLPGRLTDVLAILKLLTALATQSITREHLVTEHGRSFWSPLLELLAESTIRQERTASPTVLSSLEDVLVVFFSRVLPDQSVAQRHLSLILCNMLEGEGKFLPGVLQKLILRLLLEDDVVTVSVLNKVATSLPRSCPVPFHPKFGFDRRVSIVQISTYATATELIKGCDTKGPTIGGPIGLGTDKSAYETALKLPKDIKDKIEQTMEQKKAEVAQLFGSVAASSTAGSYLYSKIGSGSMAKAPVEVKKPEPRLPLSHLTLADGTPLPAGVKMGQLLKGFGEEDDMLRLLLTKSGPDLGSAETVKSKDEEKLLSIAMPSHILETFSECNGLALLAEHLHLFRPSVVTTTKPRLLDDTGPSASKPLPQPNSYEMEDWVSVMQDVDPWMYDYDPNLAMGPRFHLPSSTSQPTHSIYPHVILSFGLFLRVSGYSGLLVSEHRSKAQWLLRLALGVTTNDAGESVCSHPHVSSLSVLPFEVLGSLYSRYLWNTSEGASIRLHSLETGIVDVLLSLLAAFSHEKPRDSRQGTEIARTIASTLRGVLTTESTDATKPRPEAKGAAGSANNYWAKGTGFGTGSTQASWNMDAAYQKQRFEEENVSCLLKVLSSLIYPGDVLLSEEEPVTEPGPSSSAVGDASLSPDVLDSRMLDLISNSCIIPVATSYLRNDSVLDIARHTKVYESVLQLLAAMALCPQLRPMFKEPPDVPILQLLAKLKKHIDVYVAKLKPTGGAEGKTEEEASTDEGILKLVPLFQRSSEILSSQLEAPASTVDMDWSFDFAEGLPLPGVSLEERYCKTMKDLQFASIPFLEEVGELKFKVPYHYESTAKAGGKTSALAPRARRLAQETVSLYTSLPLSASSSVFVRCAEERLDIMKVLITGPVDTPYMNGCFEFDVWFPGDYPNAPMQINLQTTGGHSVRFNPNLYNDGKVCLSILNTWHGRPEERWNAQTSSFLQVLVSIQSLILVQDPYFNEPGYERSRSTPQGQAASRDYDADIRQATVRWAMLEMLRNTPPCFKDVVHKHFWLKRDEIIAQVSGWISEMDSQSAASTSSGATASATDTARRVHRSFQSHTSALKRHFAALKEELGKLECPFAPEKKEPSATAHHEISAKVVKV